MKFTRHILLLSVPFIFFACGVDPDNSLPHDGQSDAPYIEPDPDCVPTITCNSLGARCDSIIDDCGVVQNCGSCYLPYVCAGNGTPNKCENPCDGDVCKTGNKTVCNSTYGGYTCSCEPGYKDTGSGTCQKMDHVTIRLMSSNLTSGAGQTYKGPGLRILKGLKPDIVFMQEFNYSKDMDPDFGYENVTDMVKNIFGPEFSFHRGAGKIPNGIISRYPIKNSGTWYDSNVFNRHFEWALIDLPGDTDLLAVSVHLLTDNSLRPTEAKELATYIKNNAPSGAYIAIGGDFNTSSRQETVYNNLKSVVVVNYDYPDDQKGNENTNAKRNSPYDGIYVSSSLHNKETTAIVGSTKHESGLVFDSRKFTPLADVAPVKSGDSGADQMQHMAVIRDFKLW